MKIDLQLHLNAIGTDTTLLFWKIQFGRYNIFRHEFWYCSGISGDSVSVNLARLLHIRCRGLLAE